MKSPWPTKKLREIILDIGDGGTPSTKVKEYFNGKIPWVNVEDIKPEIWNTKRYLSELGLKNSSAKLWPKESVIFSFGASIGKVGIAKVDLCTKQGIAGIIPDTSQVLSKYLYYSLVRIAPFIKEIAKGMGSTIKEIRPSKLADLIEIPLPPLLIQQKIVRILDTIQEAIDIQEKIIEKTKELKKSLMAELFKYGAPSFRKGRKLKKTEIGEIPEDWEVVRLGDVAKEIIYGISKKGEKEGRYPILRMNNLEDGKINCKDLQFVNLESSEFEKFKLEKGDILFNRTNSLDLVGKTALFTLDEDFVFASYLLRIRTIKDQLLPEYLNYYFNFEKTQQDLKSLASRGASQVNISASKLSSFPIPLPPLSEQQEIAEILQTIDQKIEIEKRKKELYEELFKTMLNKIMNQEIDVEKIEV